MDKLQWFKFAPSDWMMGKIMRCPEVTQARFMRLCCLYWNKETELSEEDARIDIDDDHFDTLIKKKIIKSVDGDIFISFLDEQFDNILETSKKASIAGKASAAKRRAIAEQKVNDRSTTVQRNPTDKIRGEKIEIREDVDKDNIKKSVKYEPEVHTCFNKCLESFENHLHPDTPSKKNNWLDTIEKLNRIENLEFELIERIVKAIRNDDFWSSNFLSITKLRKNNKEGIKYIVVFHEYLKKRGNGNSKKRNRRR